MIRIDQIETEAEIAAVRVLVRAFFDLAASLDPNARTAPGFAGLEAELAALPGKYAPPDGAFLLARVDGVARGCAGYFDHGDGCCEVKRMYVCPEARGLGLGEGLIGELMARARAAGHRRMVLQTYYKLDSALRLYDRAGFVRCAPYGPVADAPPGHEVFMERVL